MATRVAAVASILLWTFVLAPPRARAQPLTERLPDSTMVYVGWSPTAALQTTATAKMLADERFVAPWRRLFQELILDLPDGVEGGGRISAHLPALLQDAAQCEGCFAVLELKQAGRRFNPQSVLMIDLGAKRQTFEQHFEPIHQRMKERTGDRLRRVKLEKSWVFTRPDRDGRARVTWGFIGDTFVMFFGDGAEEFVPKLVKGRIDKSLHDAPAFTDAMAKVPAGANPSVLTTYLDTRASLTLVRRLIEQDGNGDLRGLIANWDKLLGEIGIDNVKGLAEKTVIEEQQFVTRSLLRTDGPPRGLLEWLARPAVDEAMLKVIPQDAMAAAAFRFDAAGSYEQLKRSLANVAGKDAAEAFDQLEQGSQAMGLPVKTALESLGDQWVVYNATSQGGFALTGWTMATNVRDEAKFKKTLDTLRGVILKDFGGDAEHARLRALDADGVRVEYLEIGRWGSFVSPAWAVVGDKFVFSFYPQIVEDAARHIKDAGPSLLDNPDYQRARKRTGNAGPMLYTSGPEVTKNLYPVGLLVASLINGFGGGIMNDNNDAAEPHLTAALLPSMQRMLRYVGTDAIDIRTTPDGLLKTRTVANPLLSPLAWADSPVLWLALGIPSLGAAEEAADREKSAANLRQVGQAILRYSNENKGKFPADLATVIKAQDITQDLLKSPFGPAKAGGAGTGDIVLIQYGGPNPLTARDGHDVYVAYDQAALEQGDGTNVLFGDGHVEWVAPEVFKRGIEESKKKAATLKAEP
jgi:prepilin-type processing-associated H-X9-DG protein